MWNYRIIRKNVLTAMGVIVSYSIHEVYYNKDGSFKMMTEDSCHPYGETEEELKQDFEMMLFALSKPVLDYDDEVCGESLGKL